MESSSYTIICSREEYEWASAVAAILKPLLDARLAELLEMSDG